MEVVIAIVVIAIIIVIVLSVIGGSQASSRSLPSRSNKLTSVRRLEKPLVEPFPIEGLIGLLLVGGLSLAALKFIQSGGLKKLLQEIGKIPINVNGQQKDIATALEDDAFVRDMVLKILMKKVDDASHRERGIQALSENSHQAAADVAQMLREALDARMSRGPI